jgi:hypothetical protein
VLLVELQQSAVRRRVERVLSGVAGNGGSLVGGGAAAVNSASALWLLAPPPPPGRGPGRCRALWRRRRRAAHSPDPLAVQALAHRGRGGGIAAPRRAGARPFQRAATGMLPRPATAPTACEHSVAGAHRSKMAGMADGASTPLASVAACPPGQRHPQWERSKGQGSDRALAPAWSRSHRLALVQA